MRINDEYIVICDVLDEIYVMPEKFDKKDFSCIEKLSSSAGIILKEIAGGADTVEKLNEKICSIYNADGDYRTQIENSIREFVDMCIQKKYIK